MENSRINWKSVSLGLAVIAAALELFSRRKHKFGKTAVYPVMLAALFLGSCSSGPQPIAYGTDACEHCKMTIMDNRFGAELLNKQGKAFKFDSGECMIGYLKEGRIEQEKVTHLLVTDFSNPNTLIDAKKAFFLHSEEIPSPMGANVSAYAKAADRDQMKQAKGGQFWTWNDFYQAAGAAPATAH